MESLDVHARVGGRWGEMRRIVQRDTAFKRERRGRILKRHFLMAAILAGIAIVVLTGLFVGGGRRSPGHDGRRHGNHRSGHGLWGLRQRLRGNRTGRPGGRDKGIRQTIGG